MESFMLYVCYSTVVLCALLVGCAMQSAQQASASRPAGSSSKPLRYLALGDSYTIGESVSPDERWPVQFVALLRRDQLDIADPTIVAQTGWTTDELMAGIERARIEGQYDLVSLLIGVNNQYRGRDLEEYRTQFRMLLSQAIAFAGGAPQRVLVLSIPDWSVTPYAHNQDRLRIQAEIDRFNAVNRAEAEQAGAHYIDITPSSRMASADHELIADDGLHPSGAMYATWAQLALPAARAALIEPTH
jgi:lysophospholipase L1-like esterase